jgi:Flp pilus assembly pilin Flp
MEKPMDRRKCKVDVSVKTSFWKDDRGQDLVEYSLLLAFVCLSGAALFIGMGRTTSTLWGIVNSRLAAANQSS